MILLRAPASVQTPLRCTVQKGGCCATETAELCRKLISSPAASGDNASRMRVKPFCHSHAIPPYHEPAPPLQILFMSKMSIKLQAQLCDPGASLSGHESLKLAQLKFCRESELCTAVQEQIYSYKLSDEDEDLLEAILALGKALPRYNAYLLTPPSPDLPFTDRTRQLALTQGRVHPNDFLGAFDWRLSYLHAAGTEDELKSITHWVVGDFEAEVTCPASFCRASCVERHRS